MKHLISVCFVLWSGIGSAWAACHGIDQRGNLSASQLAEIAKRMADVPYAHGNYWTATKGDQTLHLVGTIHLDDPRLDPIAQRLSPVIAAADLVLVEATDAEEKQLQDAIATRPEALFLQDGPTLLERMGADWPPLAAAAEARGIPAFMAAKFQPWYLSLMLSMPPCVLQQMSGGMTGLDKRILDLAQTHGVTTQALESWDTLFTVFGADPLEQQIEMLRISTYPVAQAEDGIATLTAQYFEEEHGAVMDTSRVMVRDTVDMGSAAFDTAYDDLLDAVLTQRNHAWMERLDQVTATNVVVAAGAAHLGGRDGLLYLLEVKGYTLARQPF